MAKDKKSKGKKHKKHKKDKALKFSLVRASARSGTIYDPVHRSQRSSIAPTSSQEDGREWMVAAK